MPSSPSSSFEKRVQYMSRKESSMAVLVSVEQQALTRRQSAAAKVGTR